MGRQSALPLARVVNLTRPDRTERTAAMPRHVLDVSRLHPAIQDRLAHWQAPIVQAVQAASLSHALLVVGMGGNPYCKRARKLLEQTGHPFHYLGYGSYVSQWKERLALKMWTGWPTFPMVFVKGTLVGGFTELRQRVDSGELQRLLGE
jgi:monothiol glutaredoxin